MATVSVALLHKKHNRAHPFKQVGSGMGRDQVGRRELGGRWGRDWVGNLLAQLIHDNCAPVSSQVYEVRALLRLLPPQPSYAAKMRFLRIKSRHWNLPWTKCSYKVNRCGAGPAVQALHSEWMKKCDRGFDFKVRRHGIRPRACLSAAKAMPDCAHVQVECCWLVLRSGSTLRLNSLLQHILFPKQVLRACHVVPDSAPAQSAPCRSSAAGWC